MVAPESLSLAAKPRDKGLLKEGTKSTSDEGTYIGVLLPISSIALPRYTGMKFRTDACLPQGGGSAPSATSDAAPLLGSAFDSCPAS